MSTKTKVAVIFVLSLVAVAVLWWLLGPAVASGGLVAALGGLLFAGKQGKQSASDKKNMSEAIRDGLSAQEAQIKSELREQKDSADISIDAAVAALEADVNAYSDNPDNPGDWCKPGRGRYPSGGDQ